MYLTWPEYGSKKDGKGHIVPAKINQLWMVTKWSPIGVFAQMKYYIDLYIA